MISFLNGFRDKLNRVPKWGYAATVAILLAVALFHVASAARYDMRTSQIGVYRMDRWTGDVEFCPNYTLANSYRFRRGEQVPDWCYPADHYRALRVSRQDDG